jgi:hypothetical protein
MVSSDFHMKNLMTRQFSLSDSTVLSRQHEWRGKIQSWKKRYLFHKRSAEDEFYMKIKAQWHLQLCTIIFFFIWGC